MVCGACLSTCHFQSTHEKVCSLLPKHSTKINEGFAKNRWRPECVPPDRITKFVRIVHPKHSTQHKHRWRHHKESPEARMCSARANGVCPRVAKTQHEGRPRVAKPKHSARSISLIAKTQREHKVKASLRITGSQHVSSQTG